MEKELIRVRSFKDIVTFISVIIIGTTLLVLPTGEGVNVAGLFMIFSGIILAFILKSEYKETESGARFRLKKYYFQREMKASIMSKLGSKPEAIDLNEANKGDSLILYIYYSKANDMAYMQLYEYIDDNYEPCSKIFKSKIPF